MRGALISGLSCATCSASARRAACRIAGRPSWPRFWRSCAPPDAGWSRFPHGTHSSRLCAGFRLRSLPPATPQRRPLTPRAVKRSLNNRKHRGAVAIEVYPPTAYVTQLVVRTLPPELLDEKMRAAVRLWSVGEINRQIGLFASAAKTADAYALISSTVLLGNLSSPEESAPEEARLERAAIKLFVDKQLDDGTWPSS